MTYYKVLGVPEKATKAQIKKAYRKLAFLNHPDRSKKRNAKELFQKIAQAYVILSDTVSRKNYDKSIKNKVDKGEKERTINIDAALFKYRVSIIRMTTRTRKVHHLMHLTLTRSLHIGEIVCGRKVTIPYRRCVRCKECDYDGLVQKKVEGKVRTSVCSVCSGTTLVLQDATVEVDLSKYKHGNMYSFKNKGHHGGVYGGKYDNTKSSKQFFGNLYILFWVY